MISDNIVAVSPWHFSWPITLP